MHWLLEPFQYAFMRSALLAIILVGTTCAVLGCFVVLRRMAFIGDAIAHTVLPGVVVAYLEAFNLFAGALIAGLLTAIGINLLARREEIREDTAIGVVYTGMFALGTLIISKTSSFRDFSNMLIGNIIGVTHADLILIAVIAVVVIVLIALFYKELELTTVDPSYSAVIGLRADWMRQLLLILLALAVVVGIQAAGVILAPALLVTPAAAASLLTRDLVRMMILATAIAIASGVIGLYAAYYGDVSAGAAIVLAGSAMFAIAYLGRFVVNRLRGKRRITAV